MQNIKNFEEKNNRKQVEKGKEWDIPMNIVSSFSSKSLWWFINHYWSQFDKCRKIS